MSFISYSFSHLFFSVGLPHTPDAAVFTVFHLEEFWTEASVRSALQSSFMISICPELFDFVFRNDGILRELGVFD